MTFSATEHDTVSDALQNLDAAGHDRAFSIGSQIFSACKAEFDRIEASGVQPTTWHERDGQIFSVPGRN